LLQKKGVILNKSMSKTVYNYKKVDLNLKKENVYRFLVKIFELCSVSSSSRCLIKKVNKKPVGRMNSDSSYFKSIKEAITSTKYELGMRLNQNVQVVDLDIPKNATKAQQSLISQKIQFLTE
jgi:hypothetical protein